MARHEFITFEAYEDLVEEAESALTMGRLYREMPVGVRQRLNIVPRGNFRGHGQNRHLYVSDLVLSILHVYPHVREDYDPLNLRWNEVARTAVHAKGIPLDYPVVDATMNDMRTSQLIVIEIEPDPPAYINPLDVTKIQINPELFGEQAARAPSSIR